MSIQRNGVSLSQIISGRSQLEKVRSMKVNNCKELASFAAEIKDNPSSGAFRMSSIDSVPLTTISQQSRVAILKIPGWYYILVECVGQKFQLTRWQTFSYPFRITSGPLNSGLNASKYESR